MREIYDVQIEYKTYDDLQKTFFDNAKEFLLEQAEQKRVDIDEFYMISDKPSIDIACANNAGFRTILVQSGMHSPED